MNSYALENRHILITGASSGIGRACAIHFSRLGAHLTLLARNQNRLEKVLQELQGDKHRCLIYDLNDIDGIEQFVTDVVKDSGKFDGLMYCAGDCYCYPLITCKPGIVQKSMQVNFFAFTEMLRCFSKKRSSMDGASVVAMSSSSSLKGDKGLLTLSASKAAMNSVVRCASKELAGRKIRVNAIAASYIGSSIAVENTINTLGSEQVTRFIQENQPLGMGKPEDIAMAAAFLLSDASRFITGTIMSVDGGYMA